VFPLTSVAQYQVFNWYPATNWQPDAQGNFDKLTPEPQGGRALFAILDQADAYLILVIGKNLVTDLPTTGATGADGNERQPAV